MEVLLNLISFEKLLICWCIIIIATVLQIAAGMGFGMLASPLIALVKPELVPGSVLVMGLFIAIVGAWHERKNIEPQEIVAGVTGRVIGSAMAFAILLALPDVNAFMIMFGSIMLAAICFTAFGMKIVFSIRNLFGLSIVSGVMGSITAVGAPPMALIYHERQPEIIRPTLNLFFFSGCILGLISLSASGWFRPGDMVVTIAFIPALFAGVFIAKFARNFSSKFLSNFLLTLSAIASLVLIIRGSGLIF